MRGAQYRWDSAIDAQYRFAMPVPPQISGASTPFGRGKPRRAASELGQLHFVGNTKEQLLV